MIFFVLSGEMLIFLPENMIFFSLDETRKMIFLKKYMDGKWKMIFLKKYMEILYFLKMFWKDGISKKIAFECGLFCIIWKDATFLPENIFFLWTENKRWSFSRNTWKYGIFCKYVYLLQIWYYPSAKKKNKDDLLPRKYT